MTMTLHTRTTHRSSRTHITHRRHHHHHHVLLTLLLTLTLSIPFLPSPSYSVVVASESQQSQSSLELTTDEEISWRSAVISAANSHVDLERPLHDLSTSIGVQIDSLRQSQETLRVLSGRVQELIHSKSQLMEQQQQGGQGGQGGGGIKQRIQQFHSHQVEILIHKLQTSLQEEEKRRENDTNNSKELMKKNATQKVIPKDLVSNSELQEMLSMHQITQSAKDELTHLLQHHISHTWKSKSMNKVQSILSDYTTTLSTTKQEMEQSIVTARQAVVAASSSTKMDGIHSCTSVLDAANWIQSSISSTQEQNSHTSSIKGSTIVYGPEWTSDTYHQPPQSHVTKQQRRSSMSMPLGKSPMRSYIPQDWERFFPTGWEEWDLSSFMSYLQVSPLSYIPPFILHSLPYPLVSILNQINTSMDPIRSTITGSGGTSSGSGSTISTTSAPPETIFNDNMHLGHCWPFAGTNGKVTLRLSSPMIVTGVTIDHAPPIPVVVKKKKKVLYYNQGRSAPRKVSVEGFYPCDEGDEECFLGMGFDVTSSVQLSKFEYQLVQHQEIDDEEAQAGQEEGEDSSSFMDTRSSSSSRRSSQTFDFGTGIKSSHTMKEEEEEEEESLNEMQGFGGGMDPSSGSCSATQEQTSCGFDSGGGGDAAASASTSAAPLNSAVQALTIHVEDNWGHPDYTCIYRIRVHGQVA